MHRKRTSGSRGVIALIAGAAVLFVVGLSVMMAELGLASLQKFEMHDAAEAMAMAEAYQVLTQPAGQTTPIPEEPLLADNARASTYTPSQKVDHAVPIYGGPTLSETDAAGREVLMKSTPGESFMNLIGAPMAVGGNARVVVNQYQLMDMTPVPARIVLVTDYSRSMRLPYPGGGLAAYTQMQTAINSILTEPRLADRVDWGIVQFADTVGPNSGPLGLPDVYNAAAMATHLNDLKADVNGPTFGDGTDLASAIDRATFLLMVNGGYTPNSVKFGKNVMIIITDGEPDVDHTLPANTPYANLVASATSKARTSVQNAWSQGIQTISILIERETTLSSAADEQFMRDLAGDGEFGGAGGPVLGNAAVAAADGQLGGFLNQISPITHCLSSTPLIMPANSWMPTPDQNDMIYGFWVRAGAAARSEEKVKRMKTNKKMDPPPNPTSGEYDPAKAAFYFDQETHMIELNTSICMNYLGNRSNPPKFRARYGLPRISWVGSL